MAAHLRLARNPDEATTVTPEAPIRVLLADDHALMRRSLRVLLDHEDGVSVIAEAKDMAGVARHVMGHEPHVLVLDLNMPGGSGFEAISRLRERTPGTKIVAMTMQDDPVFAQRAFAAGAHGFVAKELADEELPAAVRAAARGEEFVSPRVAARLRARRDLLGG
jgi:two-component system, NarL family, response regulator NreC